MSRSLWDRRIRGLGLLLILLVFIGPLVLLGACDSRATLSHPTYTPYPTYTARSTNTPYPTYTPFPTYTLAPTQPSYPTYTPLALVSPTHTRLQTETLIAARTATSRPYGAADSSLRMMAQTIDALDGVGHLYSHDMKAYLGLISSNCFRYESIVNDFGPHGNPFSQTSITNDFGPYGNPFSHTSAFNEFATHPPAIWVWNGSHWVFKRFVTLNTGIQPRVDTVYLLAYLRQKGACE